MLPTDTYIQRVWRNWVIMFWWGMRIVSVVTWVGIIYMLVFATDETMRKVFEPNILSENFPLFIMIVSLFGIPWFLWETRDLKF